MGVIEQSNRLEKPKLSPYETKISAARNDVLVKSKRMAKEKV